MTRAELEETTMAHRFIYYVLNDCIVSDEVYDALERSVLNDPNTPANSPLREVGSSLASSYTQAQKDFAYAMLKDRDLNGD